MQKANTEVFIIHSTKQTTKQKQILAVHDISCMGRCSLTVALPVISAAGITTSVLPTAVLSTHTGGFTGYTYRDLTSDMLPIIDHWQSLPITFDAIYTGYLGSQEQLNIVTELISRLKSDLVIIDPVMADGGRLYSGFSSDFPKGMAQMCKKADVITPNITEALLMIGEPPGSYHKGPYSQKFIQEILEAIGQRTVLTGVYLSENEYGAAVYDHDSKEVHFSFAERVPGFYYGTGDLFSSVLTAALVKGRSLTQATDIAVRFTADSILRTYRAGADVMYGVNFEEGLAGLAGMIDCN